MTMLDCQQDSLQIKLFAYVLMFEKHCKIDIIQMTLWTFIADEIFFKTIFE